VNAAILREIGFEDEAMREALKKGFLNATELADYLVGRGLAFRSAHEAAGRAVAMAQEKGCGLEELSLEELQAVSRLVEDDVYAALDYENAADRRESPGGTGREAVRKQLADLKAWLETAR
jgi:argininosuccinate lyase